MTFFGPAGCRGRTNGVGEDGVFGRRTELHVRRLPGQRSLSSASRPRRPSCADPRQRHHKSSIRTLKEALLSVRGRLETHRGAAPGAARFRRLIKPVTGWSPAIATEHPLGQSRPGDQPDRSARMNTAAACLISLAQYTLRDRDGSGGTDPPPAGPAPVGSPGGRALPSEHAHDSGSRCLQGWKERSGTSTALAGICDQAAVPQHRIGGFRFAQRHPLRPPRATLPSHHGDRPPIVDCHTRFAGSATTPDFQA